jgi:SAM-dependent methyltransferase
MIDWPQLPSGGPAPVWDGHCFRVGGRELPLLCYNDNDSGWSDGLTRLHEESAGREHYIDRASRAHALAALAPVLARPNPVILEVGCSSGYFLEDLSCFAPHALAVGSDYLAPVVERLVGHLPGVPLVQFDLTAAPFRDGQFDGIVALNVLEHIADHRKALAEMARMLKPGGVAVVEVPAGPGLYDFYDAHLLHHRRYRLGELKALARDCGLEVAEASHLGFFLYPAFALVKKRNRWLGRRMSEAERQRRVGRQIQMARSSRLMNAVMGLELALGRLTTPGASDVCSRAASRPRRAGGRRRPGRRRETLNRGERT